MAGAGVPKIYYFDTAGRAEVTRLIFTVSAKPFEDIRFSYDEWLAKYKVESPLGVAPFYEEGGVKVGGSLGIARLVAEANGLGGANPMECAQLESYADALFDIATKLYPFKFGPEDKREDAKKECMTSLPPKFAAIEKNIKGDDTFLVGKATYPELLLSQVCLETAHFKLGDTFKDCPKILKAIARVDSNEKVKAFRAKHAK